MKSTDRRTPAWRRRRRLRWALTASDAASVLVSAIALVGPAVHREASASDPSTSLLVPLALATAWAVSHAVAGSEHERSFTAGYEELRGFIRSLPIRSAGLLAASSLLAASLVPTPSVLIIAVGATSGILTRALLASLLGPAFRAGRLVDRALILGDDAYSEELAFMLRAGESFPYSVIGLVRGGRSTKISDACSTEVHRVDTAEDLVPLCRRLEITVVIVAGQAEGIPSLEQAQSALAAAEIQVLLAPHVPHWIRGEVATERLAGVPLLEFHDRPDAALVGALKRALDVVGGTLIAIFLAPILVWACILVAAVDGRPVFFSQTRIGRYGRPFRLWKIRTMFDGEDEVLAQSSASEPQNHHYLKPLDDGRITGLGGRLRRWSIDEIPQLWNVIRGEMSLVGPRPLFSAPQEYTSEERLRLRVRPGLTGIWQVSGRSATTESEALCLDVTYVQNWGLLTDLRILAKTVPAVIRGRGAR